MHINRQLDILPQRRNQIKALLGRHNARHILDTQRMAAHFLNLHAQRNEHLKVMDRADRIADAALCMPARLTAFVHCNLNVAHVIQRVKNADDIHAVFYAFAYKATHGIIGIVMVTQQILAAQQHLQFGVFHVRLNFAQALPRILVQITQTAVERCSSPAFDRMIAGLIHLVQHGFKVLKRHTGRDQRLLRITQHGFGDMHLFHGICPSFGRKIGRQAKLYLFPHFT